MDGHDNILGSSARPSLNTADAEGASWTPTILLYAVLLAGAAALLVVGQREFRRWRLQGYRKSMRRRYGIPDTDQRPFNVAFAAVAQDRDNRGSKSATPLQRLPAEDQEPEPTRGNDAKMRQRRVPNGTMSNNAHSDRGSAHPLASSSSATPYISGQFALHSSAPPHSHTQPLQPTLLAHSSQGGQNNIPPAESPRKPRRSNAVNGMPTAPSRGFKRTASAAEADFDLDSSRIVHDKRARKASGSRGNAMMELDVDVDDTPPSTGRPGAAEDEEEEDQDQLMELDPLPFPRIDGRGRGKKRGRAEAGSTIGGDGEGDDSSDDERRAYIRNHRKNRKRRDLRMSGVHRSDLSGLLDSDGDNDDGGSVVSRRSKGSKVGRRTRPQSIMGASSTAGSHDFDMSMDASDFEAPLAVDPLCGGRRIGQEWEAHGHKFKVGPNGQRLRLELVKRIRQRYLMPKDSEHPDKSEDIEYFAETWLSEDEYNIAKEKQQLVWQSSPEKSRAKQAASITKAAGKQLLWAATHHSSTVRDAQAQAQTRVQTRLNPFSSESVPGSPTSASAGAFISGTSVSGSSTPTAYTNSSISALVPASPAGGRGARGLSLGGLGSPATAASLFASPQRALSKWEKQDLEAEAMAKMRARNVERREAERKKAAAAATPVAAPVASAPPTFALPTPAPVTAAGKEAEKKAEDGRTTSAPASNLFSLGKTTTPTISISTTTSTATPSAAATLFSFPSKASSDAAKPADASKPTPAENKPAAAPLFKLPGAPASALGNATEPTKTPAPTLGTPSSGTPISFGTSSPSPFGIKPTPASTPSASASLSAAPANNPFGTATTTPTPTPTPTAASTAGPTATAGAGATTATATSKPSFSFSASGSSSAFGQSTSVSAPKQNGTGTVTTGPAASAGGPASGSLLSRVGGPAAGAGTGAGTGGAGSAAQPENAKTAEPAKAQETKPLFSFNTGGSSTSTSRPGASPFSGAASTPAATSTSTPAASPFGTSTGTGTGTGTTASSTATEAKKPMFSFKSQEAVKTSEPVKPAFGASSTTGASASPFGAPSGGASAFGAKPTAPSAFGAPASGAEASKTSSAFGTASSAPTTSAFGSSTASAFGSSNGSGAFGGFGAAKGTTTSMDKGKAPASGSGSAFGSSSAFGGGAPSAFGAGAAGGASKPAEAAKPEAPKPSFSFNFGGSSTPAAAPASTTSATPAPAFGGGFGATSTPGAAPAKSPFSFGSSSAAPGANANPFGAAPASNPFGSTTGGASPFAFGSEKK